MEMDWINLKRWRVMKFRNRTELIKAPIIRTNKAFIKILEEGPEVVMEIDSPELEGVDYCQTRFYSKKRAIRYMRKVCLAKDWRVISCLRP